jgi:hypothetical protein
MRKILAWPCHALAAIAGGLAAIATQSPAAESGRNGLELIRVEIQIDRLVDGRDDEISGAARILLEHWATRRYLAEFKAPLNIDPQAEAKDDDRLEGEMKSVAEAGAARTAAAGLSQYRPKLSECLSEHDMCVKDAQPRFTCISFSTMCIATTLIPFVEGSR